MSVLNEQLADADFSDEVCSDCKEEGRPEQFLVRLPIVTEKRRIECVACPYCDGHDGSGKEMIELAYTPR
jgi:hypothetical protein